MPLISFLCRSHVIYLNSSLQSVQSFMSAIQTAMKTGGFECPILGEFN